MDGIKYKLSEKQPGTVQEDKNSLIIEKSGAVSTFTLQEFIDANKINNKNKTELTAKRNYEAAVMTNIEQNNKYGQEIKDMDEEKRYTVHMYQEAAAMVKACDKKLAELETAIVDNDAEVAEIVKQIPEVAETAPIPEVNDKKCLAEGCEARLSPLDAPDFCPDHNEMNPKDAEVGASPEALPESDKTPE